jgi:hypothetical protein
MHQAVKSFFAVDDHPNYYSRANHKRREYGLQQIDGIQIHHEPDIDVVIDPYAPARQAAGGSLLKEIGNDQSGQPAFAGSVKRTSAARRREGI